MIASMRIFTFLLFFICAISINSQSLPDHWAKKTGNIIQAGGIIHQDIYDETKVEEIRLYFKQADYWNQLTRNYNSKMDIPVRLIYKGVSYDSVAIRFKGQTSYSMNNTQKKSFNISMDEWKDQTLEGYKTLNLNNAFQDNSYMREILYYHFIRKYTPSAKANFVRLYINDEDWGIYSNVQQTNKTFIGEWYTDNEGINIRADRPDGTSVTQPGGGGGGGAMWGDGTAGFNFLGNDTSRYKQYYDLKSSGVSQTWQKLVSAADILNNTPFDQRERIYPEYFDIDKILWHLACENVFVDDDSYIYKGKMDYYLYYDVTSSRWSSYDYDANSTMSLARAGQWSPFYNAEKVNYPLLNKILQVPSFRQRYLAYYRTLMSDVLYEQNWTDQINQYDALIKDIVAQEKKKGITFQQYQNEVNNIRNYARIRKTFLNNNAEINVVPPFLSELCYFVHGVKWGNVTNKDEVTVTVKASFSQGIDKVNLYYGIGIDSKHALLEMKDDGQGVDFAANDGIFSASLPPQKSNALVCFYSEAIANNNVKTRAYLPAGAGHELMYYNVQGLKNEEKPLVINEFMATNTGVVKDPFGENEDWIELFNLTDKDINISGYYISDNPANIKKYKFKEGTVIRANDYLIVWADENGTQGPMHANFKLSAGGESILLSDTSGVILDSLTFGNQTTNQSAARKPNGTGAFVIGPHTFGKSNDGTTSVTDNYAEAIKLLIYPSPNDGNFFIKNMSMVTINAQIFEMTGRVVRNLAVQPSERSFVEGLTSGLYFVRSQGGVVKVLVTD
jgi:hypothetical protein